MRLVDVRDDCNKSGQIRFKTSLADVSQYFNTKRLFLLNGK